MPMKKGMMKLMPTLMKTPLLLLPTLALAPLAVAQPPADAPSAPPPAAQPAATKPISPQLDQLLTRLENADKELRTLKAGVKYIKTFPEIQGSDVQVWAGTLTFRAQPPTLVVEHPLDHPLRQFHVHFDTLTADNREHDEKKDYIFDGTFLVEKLEVGHVFTRHRMVAPGSSADPMRIGEGPLPLPIGQRKADMLQRFDIESVPMLDSVATDDSGKSLRAFLADTVQIRLVPKPGTIQARDFRDIRIWYRAADLLPVRALTVNTDDSKAEVILFKQEKNVELPADEFSTEPPADGVWEIHLEDRLREAAPAKTTDAPKPPGTPTGTPLGTP